MHYSVYSALVLLSTLSSGIYYNPISILSYQMFSYQIFPFSGCGEQNVGLCNVENLQECVIFWLFSGIYFNTEQYSLTAFISFKKDVLTIFSVAL